MLPFLQSIQGILPALSHTVQYVIRYFHVPFDLFVAAEYTRTKVFEFNVYIVEI